MERRSLNELFQKDEISRLRPIWPDMAYRGNDVHSTVNYNFVAPKNASFDVKLTYDMTSNKENNNITTDVHFLCEELTVQVYNIWFKSNKNMTQLGKPDCVFVL